MARYKVLKSVAHNFAHAFVSSTNYWDGDYVACHLIRASRASGEHVLEANLLTGEAKPSVLLPPPVAGSLEGYRQSLGRFVTTGGAALDMISGATLRIEIKEGPATPGARAGM